jgi:LCP family protein required for cell wall assembly
MGGKILINTAKIFHGSVFNILTTTKLKGEDVGRVNILLAGNSADDPGHDGANLTDSIMIVSIDTKNNTAFMLSVPRDLWVHIPGYGHAKINEAYVDGQTGHFSAQGYPSGGMGLLEEVIHQNFNLNINYYALIDYNAVRDAVNAVGGIDMNIQSSDPRGLYDPSIDWTTHGPLVKLSNGVHHLSGQQALDLARARGDAYGSYGYAQSDFERTQNQRLMLLALKTKILSAGVLANPVALGNLFDSLGKNVSTDMTLSEARRLYDLGKKVDNGSITSASLNQANGQNLLSNYTSPTGQSALIPASGLDNFSQIQAYITRLVSSNAVTREDATVVVLNGTNTAGLAASAQTVLSSKGITVGAVGDAGASAPAATTIIDVSAGKMPATLQLLKQLYGSNVTTTNPYASSYTADFIVILGPDQAAKVNNAASSGQ